MRIETHQSQPTIVIHKIQGITSRTHRLMETSIPANSHALCVHESHACGSKTSISCIEDNFSRLTHNSGLLVHQPLTWKIQVNFPQNSLVNGAKCRVWVLNNKQMRPRRDFKVRTVTFGNLRKSSALFGSRRDIFGNVRTSSEIFWKFGCYGYEMSRIWLRKSWQV